MKQILIFLLFLTSSLCSGQIIYSEDFETPGLPEDWQNNTNATDGGWRFGVSGTLSSQAFQISSNDTRMAVTNDDACNCDKSNDFLVTNRIDLSNENAAVLKFDLFYGNQEYQGSQERATVEISPDGTNWTVLDHLHGHGGWDQHLIDITEYVGNEAVYIGFRYDDGGGYLYGMAIDNVAVEVPNSLDASLVELEGKEFGEVGKEFGIGGTILNNGIETITSMEIQYVIGTNPTVIEVFGLNHFLRC